MAYLLRLRLPRHPLNDPESMNYRHIVTITRHRHAHAHTHNREDEQLASSLTNH
jgi:hypothetical protein